MTTVTRRTAAVGGAWTSEEGGSLVADPSFKFEAKFPSNRFIGVTESGSAFFDKPGARFDYTLFTLEEMASEMAASPIEFQTVRVYRSVAP